MQTSPPKGIDVFFALHTTSVRWNLRGFRALVILGFSVPVSDLTLSLAVHHNVGYADFGRHEATFSRPSQFSQVYGATELKKNNRGTIGV
jgi:hypothetical protein